MNNHTKVAGGVTGAVLALLTITIGLPVIAVAGLTDSPGLDPGGDPGFAADGIPATVADAYQQAAAAAPGFSPPCEIPVWVLAGIGEIESGHGTHGGAAVAPNGDIAPPIIGIALPGLGDDTDDGIWDGSTTVDHAVGPMQFIPATWRAYGRDGNGDGYSDPHNIYDAALAAAAYLCASGSPMATEVHWRQGIYAYNRSRAYVDDVLEAAARYRDTPPAPPVSPGSSVQLVTVAGVGATNAEWAPQVEAMLAAADADGVTLTGGSYRDPAQQITLRRAHCGPSRYAIYEMPASECSPPTAKPGTSNHEIGLAIDFDNCSTRNTTCWRWLNSNAARYGLYPLDSEPWHWSVDGR